MIIEELKKLAQGDQPQTLDELFKSSKKSSLMENLGKIIDEKQPHSLEELFRGSKEEDLLGRLTASINVLLPQMRERLAGELKTLVNDEIKRQVGAIKVRDGQDGKEGAPGKSADEKKIIEIILEQISPKLKKEEVEIEKVKGLQELLDNILSRITSIGSRKTRGGGGDTIIADDLSSQADGSTRTFTTTKRIGKPLLVVSSQFPQVLRLTTDFTASGTTLTLDSSLTAIVSGQTLYFVYAEG